MVAAYPVLRRTCLSPSDGLPGSIHLPPRWLRLATHYPDEGQRIRDHPFRTCRRASTDPRSHALALRKPAREPARTEPVDLKDRARRVATARLVGSGRESGTRR